MGRAGLGPRHRRGPIGPKDSETEITLSVPVEEGGHTHANCVRAMHEGHDEPGAGENQGQPSAVYNEEVDVAVPRQFEVLGCDKTADWDCKAEPAKGAALGQAPGGTITFTRLTKSGTTMDHLSLHRPHAGQQGHLPPPDEPEAVRRRRDRLERRRHDVDQNPAPTVQVTDEAAGRVTTPTTSSEENPR